MTIATSGCFGRASEVQQVGEERGARRGYHGKCFQTGLAQAPRPSFDSFTWVGFQALIRSEAHLQVFTTTYWISVLGDS